MTAVVGADATTWDSVNAAALRRAEVRALEARHPGTLVWFGEATGAWWALLPRGDGGELLEAATLDRLTGLIAGAWARRRP